MEKDTGLQFKLSFEGKPDEAYQINGLLLIPKVS